MKNILLIAFTCLFAFSCYSQKTSSQIKESIKRGDNLDFVSTTGRTMLMDAAALGDEKLITELIKNNVEVNRADTAGATALMIASEVGCFDCVLVLLKNNANPLLYDHKLKTALDYAKKSGNEKVISKMGEYIKPLVWYTIEEALKLSEKNPKMIFVDVYTDWCGWCKVMDANTFSHPYISKILMENFYPVKFNAEQKAILNINGKQFINQTPETNKSTHDYASYLLKGRLGYPTVVVLNSKGESLQAIPGYKKPTEMEVLLMFYASGKYKDTDWNVFQKQFKSNL